MTYYKTPLGVCEIYKISNKKGNKRIFGKFIDGRNEVEIQSMIGFKKIGVLKYMYYLLLSKL